MQKTSPQELFSHRRLEAVESRAIRMACADADFLARIAADTIAERLDATNREFKTAFDLFSPFDCMFDHLEASSKVATTFRLAGRPSCFEGKTSGHATPHVAGDRQTLPLGQNSVNLVTSIFGLHWSNDLPGMFAQIKQALAADGLFLAALPGDKTLKELRECLLEAESQLLGSARLRIDPFGEVRQLGNLLQRTGFSLPVVDTELLTVRYHCLKSLIKDLRAMGATSVLNHHSGFGSRQLFEKTEEIYNEKYQDSDGKISVTFEIVFLSGWSPHASQQKPLKPGSAKNLLSDFL